MNERKPISDEWYTPKWVIDALGPFNLDPCSPAERPFNTAAVHWTKSQDGLLMPWGTGRVWLNPPYSKDLLRAFVERLAAHGNGIALLKNRTARMAATKTILAMPKQMLEISTSKTVDNALGDYIGRTRNKQEWTKEDYDWQNNKGTQGRQYGVRDWSRASLNFEVVIGKHGKPVVQPIDHAKPSLQERWQQRIDEGYKAVVHTKKGDVRKPIKKSEIKIVKMELGGNRDRMHELAFDRKVNLGKRGIGTNGDVHRREDIEQWAIDCYNHLAKKYGAANIIDFVVHLDETNPHIHVTLVPLTQEGKLSYTELFGGSHAQAVAAAKADGTKPNFQKQMSKYTKQLHTDFFNDVGAKWGLDRGDDIKITGNTHKSTEESLREKNAIEEEIAQKDEQLQQKNSSVLIAFGHHNDEVLRSCSIEGKYVRLNQKT